MPQTLSKEEIRKLRLENLKKGLETRRARRDAKKVAGTNGHVSPVPAKEPPPLPPIAPPEPVPSVVAPPPPIVPVAAPSSDEKLKDGLAKVFCSATKGLANGLNLALKTTDYEILIDDVSEGESVLWAEFALPVLKTWMPNLQAEPMKACAVFTILILSGKIKVKKKEVSPNVGTQENQSGN